MKSLDITHKIYPKKEAEETAKILKESDPDWNYRVKNDPAGKGHSFIEVYDENGNFVARLT